MSLCSLYKVFLTVIQFDHVATMPLGSVKILYSHIDLFFDLFFRKDSKNKTNFNAK